MPRFTLEVLLDGDAASGWVVRSPGVGIWSRIPAVGAAVADGGAGRLVQAGRRFELTVPAKAAGIVAEGPAARRRELAVEWGRELFRIAAPGDAVEAGGPLEASVAASAGDVLPAASDGVFYSRPTPDAPPFTEPGSSIRRGQPVGLIEVMKTFNHVLFEGQGLPDSAVVIEFLVGDGEEVAAGDPILRFES